MREFEEGVDLWEVVTAVKGIVLNSTIVGEKLYGYTVIDSVKAIMSLTGSDFLSLLGSTSQRVVVFTKVTTGRSPMIALRVSTIKPAAIVLHGPRKVDSLALWIAESERVPVILSTALSVEDLVSSLSKLASSPR
jgi:putative transcriptional regulator